jgi:hypothetical protein
VDNVDIGEKPARRRGERRPTESAADATDGRGAALRFRYKSGSVRIASAAGDRKTNNRG